MSSDVSDEQLERVVRRAIRAELRVLGGRLFWTVIAAFGLYLGLFLVVSGSNGRGGVAVAFVILGVAMIGLAIRTLLLKWRPRPVESRSS